jgi:hypothetical protein
MYHEKLRTLFDMKGFISNMKKSLESRKSLDLLPLIYNLKVCILVVVQFCKTSPYVYERVKQIKVTVGNDGSNDNVKASYVLTIITFPVRSVTLKLPVECRVGIVVGGVGGW